MKDKLDLSNYPAEADFKNETGADTFGFAKKLDLANLKSNVDKLDIDKLKNVPINWRNLKSKGDELDVYNLILLKKMYVILRSKMLKIKYLILPT